MPFAKLAQLNASVSVGSLAGTGVGTLAGRVAMERALAARRPLVVILSPPCTMFSRLTWPLNHGRTEPDKWDKKCGSRNICLRSPLQLRHVR